MTVRDVLHSQNQSYFRRIFILFPSLVLLPSYFAVSQDSEKALENLEFRKAEKLALREIKEENNPLSQSHLILAKSYRYQGKYEEAQITIRSILLRDSLNLDALAEKAALFSIKKQLDSSSFYHKKIFQLDSTHVPNLRGMGAFYYWDSIQYPLSEKYYRMAIRFHPNDIRTLYNLGLLYGEMSQYEKSIDYLKMVADHNPKDFHVPYYIAMGYYSQHEYAIALGYFKSAKGKYAKHDPYETILKSEIDEYIQACKGRSMSKRKLNSFLKH